MSGAVDPQAAPAPGWGGPSGLAFGVAACVLGGFTLWAAGPGVAEDHIRLTVFLAVTWVLVLLGYRSTESAAAAAPGARSALGRPRAALAFALAAVATACAAMGLTRADVVAAEGWSRADQALAIAAAASGAASLAWRGARGFFLAGLALTVLGYFVTNYLTLVNRAGAWTDADLIAATVAVLLSLEVARRGMGWAMPLIALAAIGYAHFGQSMPSGFAHRGVSLERIANYLFYSQEGVFGIMTSVMANYVLVFILLGAFMARSGMGRFFIEFPLALAGRAAGGPAKVAVFSSGVFGSISGSSLANIVSTGTFTIPLMKKVGFRPAVAGAVENSASLGGQLLPPVMGAGVFVMAEITGIPYVEIIAVAAAPALIYFASIIFIVHFEAKRTGVGGVPESEMARPWDVFRRGWFHILPFAVLLAHLIAGYSPDRAALMAIGSILVINWIRHGAAHLRGAPRPEEIFDLRGVYLTLVEGVRNSLVVGAIAACVGVIVGMIALTGFGLRMSLMMVDVSGGSLLLTLVLIALASLVLGMALPITAAYLVLIVLAAPALDNLGVPLIAAHLIVFWLSQDSNITPPVCLGAFVAASIAKAPPWATAWLSFRFAKMLYVMPLLFAYTPILFTGSTFGAFWTIATATIGALAFAAWTMGYLLAPTRGWERAGLALAALGLFTPYDLNIGIDAATSVGGAALNLAGATLLAALALWQRRRATAADWGGPAEQRGNAP